MAKQVDSSNIGGLLEALITKIKAAFWRKSETSELSIDNAPTSGSNNLVKSGGVYSALADKYKKPSTGIPASDLATGVIPDVSSFITKSVNDLVNYYTKNETYTRDEVAALIGSIQQFHYETYASRQKVVSPANNVLYLIGPTGSGTDKYEEYVYDSTKQDPWVKIGDTSIDLSGYVTTQALNNALAAYTTTSDLTTLLAGKQDTINDLADIRSGAAAGATAYQKPSGGIPASDLASGVIPTVPTDIVKYTEQSLTDAQKEQARTNIGAKDSEVFWAEYGVTTVAEINAQVSAGKSVFLLYQNQQLWGVPQIYSLFVSAPAAVMFYSFFVGGLFEITASDSGGTTTWDEPISSSLELIDNKVISWQTTPDHNHYPSEKLVKDSLNGKQPTIDASHKLDYSLLSNTPTIPTTYAGSPTAGGFANKAVAIPFGNVDSTSTATALTATVDNFPTTLTDGVCAYIRNNAVASASGFTLNINGTGALPVYQTLSDESRATTIFSASTTYLFVYNSTRVAGGCWDIYYGYNSNDNTVGYNLRTNGASAPPAAQKYYRYRLLFTAANGLSLVPANTSSSTSATTAKTVNQTKIDPFGVIFYYSYTSAVNASASPNASYLWMQYNGISLGYSFNRTGEALEMTARDPVYLKCAPQSDGSAIIDEDNPIVQALPTTADGKIYIFLGFAESATAITLYYWHPVYYYKDVAIRVWTNAEALPSIDQTPTEDSDNLVTSGGVYDALQGAGTVQDVTVGGTSVVTNKVAVIPDIPDEIDTVAVTVDANTGTPSATGSVSGSTLSLAFHNLKGDTGAQGPQGNSGYTGAAGELEVVNNLTDGGAAKALSAEMGKTLQGEVDQLEAEVLEDVFDYPFVPGNYLDANGAEVSFWNGSCTDFIEAKTGDDFFFTGQTTGAFRNVCGYNASKVFVSVLYMGAGNNTKITITDSTIAYVRCCANNNDSGKSFIKMNYNSLGMLSNRIDALGENIKTLVYDGMTSDFVSGYYINHRGQKTAGDLYGYKEFSVLAGAVIVFSGQVNGGFAAIAKKISSTSYKELVAATATTAATFTYTATEDMTIAVSFYPAYSRSINIDTLLIGSNRTNIVKLQNDFQSLEDGMEIREIDLGFLFNKIAVIGDSMSVATMDGYTPPLGASWLSFLAKRWASVGKEWYAMGGTSAYDWLNNSTYGLGKLLADETIYNCYFIAYGHNDNAAVGDATDESAPVTITDGVPSCPSGYSFCAYYKAIINQIRTKAPHAMIFCLSQYDYSVAPGGWHSQYGEAVVDVAELIYNGGDKLVHHLDTGGVPDADMELGSHYSTVGYAYIAKRINDEANKVIYQYRADTEIKTFGVYNL